MSAVNKKVKKKYPYQDTEKPKLPGERWRQVPGFEGYYEASTKGRVRSVDRTIPHPRLYKQFVKGRILKQSVARNKNIKTGEPMIDLRVSLNLDGHSTYFNTRRLIYSTFKERIDYQEDGKYVINIDGDGYNCSIENLRHVTKSEKQKRVLERDRVDIYLKTADRSKWKKNYSRRKPVSQYKNGKLLRSFESITAASKKTGYGEKEIITVAKGRAVQWDGYVWKYSNSKLTTIKKQRKKQDEGK